MKKHILALIALATTTIFCLTACGKLTPEEETVQLSNKLTKILPKKAQDWKLGKIAPTVDKLGVNAEFNLISRNIIADSIQPGQLDETFTAGFQSLFCEGKKINSKMALRAYLWVKFKKQCTIKPLFMLLLNHYHLY